MCASRRFASSAFFTRLRRRLWSPWDPHQDLVQIAYQWQREKPHWSEVGALAAVRGAENDPGTAIIRLRESTARALESGAQHVRDGGAPGHATSVAEHLYCALGDLENLQRQREEDIAEPASEPESVPTYKDMDLRGALKMMAILLLMGIGANSAVWGLGALADLTLKRRTATVAAELEASRRAEERRVRELNLYFEQSALVALHTEEVDTWCEWIEREPSLDEPYEVWSRWLDEARPLYLFTFGAPNVCLPPTQLR